MKRDDDEFELFRGIGYAFVIECVVAIVILVAWKLFRALQ